LIRPSKLLNFIFLYIDVSSYPHFAENDMSEYDRITYRYSCIHIFVHLRGLVPPRSVYPFLWYFI
jgi:hypothetical protein